MTVLLLVVYFMLVFWCQILESSPAVGVVGGVVNMNMTISDRDINTNRNLVDPNNVILLDFVYGMANPAYTDTNVTYTGNILEGYVSFTLSNLTMQSAGIYQYIVSKGIIGNVIAGEQYLVIAESPSTPVITGFSQQAVAGREYKLNCSALSRSEKPGHNLTMFSEWKRNGVNIMADTKYGVNGTILTIRNLSRTDNTAGLTCLAFEDQRRKSPESIALLLNVYYGPDNTQISSSGQLTVDEIRLLNITCSGECNPPCSSYQWYKDSQLTLLGSSQALAITIVSRNSAGVYSCTVNNTNIAKIATAQITVKVNYGPDHIALSPSQVAYIRVENSSLNVSCSADCVPSCQYRWTGPGVNYPVNTGILSISKISRNQAGVITCTAYNPIITSNSATATVSVTVQYGPDIPVLTPDNTVYTVNESSVPPDIRCSADCFPSCTSHWYKEQKVVYGNPAYLLSLGNVYRNATGTYSCRSENMETNATAEKAIQLVVQCTWYKHNGGALEKLLNSDKYNIIIASSMVDVNFYSVRIHEPGFIATLEIRNITEEDFSLCQVHVQNSVGEMYPLQLQLRVIEDPTIQTSVGSDANFSFVLTENPNTTLVNIKDKSGVIVMTAVDSVGVSKDPLYKDRVNFTGNTNQKLLSFILRNVTLSDAGIYTAVLTVPNRTIGSQMLIVKASPFKPKIVELQGHAVNGINYHLNCSAQSSSQPPNHNLSMFSEWRRDDMLINSSGRYIVNGTELTITSIINKQDNGSTLTCVAFEDQLSKSVNSDKFIMDVKYGPDKIQLSPSDGIITEGDNGKIVVNCTADCNPPCSFKWTKDLVPTPLSYNQILLINNVSKSDTGRYLCNVSNSITGISMTASINVTIIYGPVSAQIFPSEFPLKIEETATMKITCSADCYPDCNFTWNGPPNFFQNDAQLSRIVDRDKGGNYTCTATNERNLEKKATVSVMVIVLYGPGNSVNLGSFPPTLGVDLHQTAPDITCNATCNPPCDYRWYQNGTFFRNGAILSLGIVEKTTRGNYRCEAYTSVLGVNRSSSTSVNITVYYAPEVLLHPAVLSRPSVYILKLGQTNVGLTCLVIDANPPVQQFIWTKDGHDILTQTSSTFTITMVTKDTMGRWGCKGVNSKGNPLESILDIDIHYGPIITNLPSITKMEGDQINVTCMVDSRPDPSSITWTKSQNNTFTQNKAEMYISHLNRADKGTYECTAVNTIRPTVVTVGEIITVKSNYILDVTFGAGIVNLSVTDNTVSENSSVIFQCHVDSNPPSTITWMKESNSAVLKTESGVVQSQYRIESAECLNMDNYTCSAYNGIWTPAKATIPLFVRCHPRTDYRLSHETKIYRRHYEAAVLRYTVISYPFPTFNWTFLGNGSKGRDLPFSAIQHNNGLQSELWIFSLGMDDFGNYSVIADNSLPPSAREILEIIPADVPEVPSNVMIVEITQTSVKVQWMAGNNGGLKQIFHVVVTAGSLVRNVTADDPGYRENGTVVLQGLLPKTKYSIYMKASNSYGSSNMTEAIIITTLEVITPDSSSSTFPLPAVAGGIGAGVVVILLAVVVLFLWRRYHHHSQHTDGTQRNQINTKSVRVDAVSGQDYEGLHINNTEATPYLQLNDITLEENRNAKSRPPENDSYETLHSYANSDIQMYTSLKIPQMPKDSERMYENTRIKATDLTGEYQ